MLCIICVCIYTSNALYGSNGLYYYYGMNSLLFAIWPAMHSNVRYSICKCRPVDLISQMYPNIMSSHLPTLAYPPSPTPSYPLPPPPLISHPPTPPFKWLYDYNGCIMVLQLKYTRFEMMFDVHQVLLFDPSKATSTLSNALHHTCTFVCTTRGHDDSS